VSQVLRATYGHGCAVNFDWPWCPTAPAGQAADLRIVLGSLGRFAVVDRAGYKPYRQRPASDPTQPPLVRLSRGDDGHYRLAYADGTEFAIDATATEVFGVAGDALTHDDLLVYLQGPVLGFVLRLRGVTCLHASAAVLGGRAFGVLGRGGMGKSTSAAIFAGLGLPVLTDDVLALAEHAGGFDVQPGLPRILLWSETARTLFGDAEALPRIVDTWDKRYLDLAAPPYTFARRASPLGALYVLGERLDGGAAPEISPLRGPAALTHLLANTYANDFLDGPLRARELEVLGRLVNRLPIRLVRAPHDPARARAVCEAILDDLAKLRAAA
jgi:hypothetical protein